MDYTGLFAGQPSAAPVRATTAPTASGLGQELDRLVSGTLAAQDYRDRVESLTHAVRATDEKVLNLTRLVKLSQSIQEEKEVELRRQNDELRARLKRQEQLTVQLQRQLEEVQVAMAAQTVQASLRQFEARVAAEASRQEERWEAVQARLGELGERVQRSETLTTQRVEERLTQLDESVQRVAQASVEATNQWAKRNFVRVKERVDSLRVDLDGVRGGQQELATALESASCRAEAEYKKVVQLLQRKTTEADALAGLVDKELRHLQRVAHQHQILASKNLSPSLSLDEKPYHTLKFSSSTTS